MANKSRLWIVLGSILTLIVIGVGIFYFYQKNKNQRSPQITNETSNSSNTQNTTNNLESNKQEAIKFNLYKEEGQISYKAYSNASYQELKDDQIELADKSFIKTGVGALAHVIFNDNSMVSLDENTEIQVNYTGASRDIAQTSGNTWHRIQKLTDNSAYQVETSNTLATVRGTIFGVKVENPTQTSLYVIEHQVEVSQTALENGKKINKATQMVQEGKHLGIPDFGGDKKPDLTDIPEEKKNSPWFKRNKLIDGDYKQEQGLKLIQKIKNDANFKQKLKNIKDNKPLPKLSGLGAALGKILKNSSPEISSQTLSNPETTLAALDASNYSCDELTGVVDFTAGLTALEQSGQIPAGTIQSLKNYYSQLTEFCKDGNLDPSEITRLSLSAQAMSKNFASLSNPDATAADPNAGAAQDASVAQNAAYTAEIQAKLSQWGTIDPQTKSADLCTAYYQSNVTIIVGQFVAIEKKYNQPVVVAGKVKPLISQIAISCRDGAIDDAETQEIAKLYPNDL